MNPTWHPADGRKYESKSTFRRVTKAHGYQEIGNDKPNDTRRYDRVSRDEVRRAVEMVRQGYRPKVLPE